MWIGIDLGTSGCKVVAVDGDGQVVATATHGYPLSVPRAGWAEQDPADWWTAAGAGVREVVAQLSAADEVRGIGLCGQMHGLTALDESGTVLRPAILWNDQRCSAECEEIVEAAAGLDGLLAMTGNRMLPGYTAGKLLWMRSNEPELFARMRLMLNPKDYLRLLMTGSAATDVSDASGTGLFDVRHRRWSTELLALLDLDPGLFPRAYESTEVTGGLLPEVAEDWGLPTGTPVVGGGGDSVLQTTSMGIIEPGLHGVTLGTAGLVGAADVTCPDNPDGRVQVSCGNEPGRWQVMGVSLNAGGAYEWLRTALAPVVDGDLDFSTLNRLAREAPPACEGLMFLPYLAGERCPHVAPEARGSWIGLTGRHSARHLVRSVLEGVLLNVREVRDVVTDSVGGAGRVRVSGGATGEDLWLQLLADVLGEEVVTVAGCEQGGAFGAALLAGVGTGGWSSLGEALEVVTEERVVRPDPAHRATYDEVFDVFRTIHPALAETFGKLAALGTPAPPAPGAPSPVVSGPPVSTVVLDLDGTLVDTAADIANAINEMLAGHDLPPQTPGYVESYTGHGARELVAGVYEGMGVEVDDERLDADLATYQTAYRRVPVKDSVLYADAREALVRLKRHGVPVGICTNKGEAMARTVLEHLGVADLIDVVVGADTLKVHKPDPHHLLETIRRLGGDPASTLFVGDTPIDVETGRRAEVRTWLVDWSGVTAEREPDLPRLAAFDDLVKAAGCTDTTTANSTDANEGAHP